MVDSALLANILPVRSTSPEQTQATGAAIADALTPGCVVALYGELGAGKTELVRGICTGFGIEATTVTSPTFAIVNEYAGGACPLFHFDVYRMQSIDELYELGYEDYFFSDGITLVEWPSRIEELLPADVTRISICHVPEGRLIELMNRQ